MQSNFLKLLIIFMILPFFTMARVRDTIKTEPQEKRIYNTTRANAKVPKIDGLIDPKI